MRECSAQNESSRSLKKIVGMNDPGRDAYELVRNKIYSAKGLGGTIAMKARL